MRQILACSKCKKEIYYGEMSGKLIEMDFKTSLPHRCIGNSGFCPRCKLPITYSFKKGKRLVVDINGIVHICASPDYRRSNRSQLIR